MLYRLKYYFVLRYIFNYIYCLCIFENINNFNNKKWDKFNISIIKMFYLEIKIFNLFGVYYLKNIF